MARRVIKPRVFFLFAFKMEKVGQDFMRICRFFMPVYVMLVE